MFCVYIKFMQKDTRAFAKSLSNFLQKQLEDIQMILQLAECLFAINTCEQNMIPTCHFMFMQHNSHSDKVSLCKSINLQTIYIVMDSL